MAVAGVVDVVGVVEHLAFAEVELLEQAAFHQEGQGPVYGGPGNGGFDRARPEQELFGGVVVRMAEGRLDDGIPLGGAPQSAGLDEFINAVAYSGFHNPHPSRV